MVMMFVSVRRIVLFVRIGMVCFVSVVTIIYLIGVFRGEGMVAIAQGGMI